MRAHLPCWPKPDTTIFRRRATPYRSFAAAILTIVGAAVGTSADAADFTAFESAHVRPLALAHEGSTLLAVNTPDNRLAIYSTTADGVSLAQEVTVGLEPVSVAIRKRQDQTIEAWVVNHLSDSVSIVEIPPDLTQAKVVRTLWVGDEPRDIVFAGPEFNRAFVTTAHRGQNRPEDPQLTTQGTPRADVWVFDADDIGDSAGGTPLQIIELFGDTPRALAASPDGKTVYAAVFASGNRTTTIAQPLVSANGDLPPPPAGATPGAPQVGLIVKNRDGGWRDELDRDWSAQVPFSLPDYDVFEIDATASPPKEIGRTSGVGTVLYNMAINPADGRLFVTNTDALNDIRFEPSLNGRFAPNRISIINGNALEQSVDINPHIDYAVPTGSQQERDQSLATPMQLEFSPDGKFVYVAAFGSAKVGVFDTTALIQGRSERRLIDVGMGPSGLALDSHRDRLYVMNRIDHTLSIVDRPSSADPLVQQVPLPTNPEPASVQAGRRFLYDAHDTSGHGDVSCHSCHLFGDVDHLAWDLGNPFGDIVENPNERNPAANPTSGGDGPAGQNLTPFHPMKGPMTTQSLRGLADTGPMHWRGDKTGGLTLDGTVNPDGDPYDEIAAFKLFNAAFEGLQGREELLSDTEMQQFAEFMLQVRYPPNPIKALDDEPTEEEAAGAAMFSDNDLFPQEDNQACASCHVLPLTTNGAIARTAQVAGDQADFKIAQLRNTYQKVGMFGAAKGTLLLGSFQGINLALPLVDEIVGDQVRGFGYTHDGSISTLNLFIDHPQNLFSPLPNQNGLTIEQKKRNVEQYLLSIDTGLKPIVGQQLTLTAANSTQSDIKARVELLIAQADMGNADLVVHGRWQGRQRGAYYDQGRFVLDESTTPKRTLGELIASVNGAALTFMAVPPGNGRRIAIDRDLDGVLNGDPTPSVDSASADAGAPMKGGTLNLHLLTTLLLLAAAVRGRNRRANAQL